MKRFSSHALRRSGAVLLTAGLLCGLAAPAGAAESFTPSCDETYYATLDYYGNLTDSSVVKSYRTYGSSTLTDYGVYDEVINLTDSREASMKDGVVTFDLTGDVPDKFYFEGKTTKPYEDFPWTLSLSYTLNGVPTQAPDLAGKTGVVEITLDAVPNPAASEYSRNNLVLTATSLFNGGDILSLEAPGAQVQLVGNLYCVLYAVLPGEEQHFTIRVGAENFSYNGMIFLAVPATLDQLSQVSDLREAKDKVEDSYDALNDSLDAILNSLDGMGSSLTATASGLDQLNTVRGSVSNNKDAVYDKTELALSDLDALANTLGSLDGYTDTASQAITDLNGSLNDLNTTVQALTPELENTRKTITAIQKDTAALKGLLSDVEGYNKKATAIASSLADELDDLDDETEDLELRLNILESALNRTKGVSKLTAISVGGMTSASEVKEKVAQVKQLHAAYELQKSQLPEGTSFKDFVVLYYYQQAAAKAGQGLSQEEFLQTEAGQQAVATAEGAAQLYDAVGSMSDAELEAQLTEMKTYNETTLPMINAKITEINSLITNLTVPTANLVGSLADLTETLGDVGVTDDLANLAGLCRDLLKTMKEHEGEGAALLDDVDDLGDMVSRLTCTADTALTQLDDLTGTLNTYEPTLQSALVDVQTLSGSAQSTLHDTSSALTSAKDLLKDNGPALDSGTRQTLSSLSEALRKAAKGLNETDTVRASKNTITDLIDDEWNTYTGEENNLLLMDAQAAPESLTDSRNSGTASIQYIMRSQEIKVDEAAQTEAAVQQTDKGTFWSRVKAMFVDIWNTIFHHGSKTEE